jgi:hypothetical protein
MQVLGLQCGCAVYLSLSPPPQLPGCAVLVPPVMSHTLKGPTIHLEAAWHTSSRAPSTLPTQVLEALVFTPRPQHSVTQYCVTSVTHLRPGGAQGAPWRDQHGQRQDMGSCQWGCRAGMIWGESASQLPPRPTPLHAAASECNVQFCSSARLLLRLPHNDFQPAQPLSPQPALRARPRSKPDP